MLYTLTVNASAGWVDTGITVPAGVELSVAVGRFVTVGGTLGTDTGWPVGSYTDSGGIYTGFTHIAYPEGSYGDSDLTHAEDPSSVQTADARGALHGPKCASNLPPFCLAMAFSSSNPGFGYGSALRPNRAKTFSTVEVGAGGKLWMCVNDYYNCFANAGFFDVTVAWPETGETIWCGTLVPSDSAWVDTGLALSGDSCRIVSNGLCKCQGEGWVHPEGAYGNLNESNPAYHPSTVLGWADVAYGTRRVSALEPFEVVAKVAGSAPGWGTTALNCDRDVAYTSPVLGAGNLYLAQNTVQENLAQNYGWHSVVVVAETDTTPVSSSASAFQIAGNYDTHRMSPAKVHVFGIKGI